MEYIKLTEYLQYTLIKVNRYKLGYKCTFVDENDNEYIGVSSHSPYIARINAKKAYKAKHRDWAKNLSQSVFASEKGILEGDKQDAEI